MKITVLLYIGILIIPFAFYGVFSTLDSMESASVVVRQTARVGGEMLKVPIESDRKTKEKSIQEIDKTLSSMKPWFVENNDANYYVGVSTPLKDYEKLLACWEELKKNYTQKMAVKCWTGAMSLSFAIERKLTLQHERLKNILYITVAGILSLLILLVFFTRTYIRHQLEEQAIHDEETGLYNRKYAHAVLSNLVAQAERSKKPLSILSLEIRGFDIDSEDRILKFLERFGGCIQHSIRRSDIPCRFESNEFLLLLPETPGEGAEVFKKRLQKECRKELGEEFPELELEMEIVEYRQGEKAEEFWMRAAHPRIMAR